MDDGLQNGSLSKNLVLAVVDARRGIGNGRVLPAGPLRAPLGFQLGLADGIVVNVADDTAGESPDESPFVAWLRDNFGGPVLRAATRPEGDTAWLADLPVVAYSGIGAPERFFRLVERLGGRIVLRRTFADHHAFTAADADGLLRDAEAHAAVLCTTEKDFVRLAMAAGPLARLRDASRVVAIRVDLGERDEVRLASLIEASLVARSGFPA
jgi:tetraacyldisaccharide 4'-kinase